MANPDQCPAYSSFFGAMGATSAIVFTGTSNEHFVFLFVFLLQILLTFLNNNNNNNKQKRWAPLTALLELEWAFQHQPF